MTGRCLPPVLLALLSVSPAAAQPQPWRLAAPVPPDAGTMDAMIQAGELVVLSRRPDRYLPNRTHEYLAQYVDGVRVHGAGLSLQRAAGRPVSVFGAVHRDITIATTPTLSPDEAAAHLGAGGAAPVGTPELVVFPLPVGGHVLAYRALLGNALQTFIDANTGDVLWQASVLREQRAIGVGTGIAGDRKNVSTTRSGSEYGTIDRFRPAEIVTLDMGYSERRLDQLTDFGEPGVRRWNDGDVATDDDNDWTDPAAVDAHTHTGWTYDYFAQRHNWFGVDGMNGRIISLVNNDFVNAFYAPPPIGPEGTGVFVYGEIDGVSFATEDIVAHELMHGVIDAAVSQRTGDPYPLFSEYSVAGPRSFRSELAGGVLFTCANAAYRLPDGTILRPLCTPGGRFLLWTGDGGIIHEAYADIVGHAVEFFHEDRAGPLMAGDYEGGEHLPLEGRVSDDPRSREVLSGLPYPDAARGMWRFLLAASDDGLELFVPELFIDGRYEGWVGFTDGGGVHINSTVLSHAFYLAIEGGTNRTTGRSVTGVGGANRGDVERAFFRAVTDLLPADASLDDAARAIRQSAVDLFGASSATATAVAEALRAVGL